MMRGAIGNHDGTPVAAVIGFLEEYVALHGPHATLDGKVRDVHFPFELADLNSHALTDRDLTRRLDPLAIHGDLATIAGLGRKHLGLEEPSRKKPLVDPQARWRCVLVIVVELVVELVLVVHRHFPIETRPPERQRMHRPRETQARMAPGGGTSSSSFCKAHIWAYKPSRSSSSRCVPRSTIRP